MRLALNACIDHSPYVQGYPSPQVCKPGLRQAGPLRCMVVTTHHVQGTPSPPPACELGCPASRSVASQGLPGRPVATRRVCHVERFTAHLWSLPSAGAPPQQLLSSLPTSPHPQQGCQGGQFRQASCFCSCSRGNTNRAEPALIVVFLLLLKTAVCVH